MVYKEFIEKIIKALKEKKVTLRKVSEYAGIDVSYLSKILSGKRNPPYDDNVIIKIAEVLDINEDELLFAAGKIPKKFQKYFSSKNFLGALYRLTNNHNDSFLLSSSKNEKKSIKRRDNLSEKIISDELL